MKKNNLFCTIAFFALFNYTVKSQDSLVHIGKKEYIEITDGFSVNESKVWGGFNTRFQVPIGFTYEFLGKSFNSVTIETSGRLVFDEDHFYFADAFSEISLQDIGMKNGKSVSPITFKNEMTSNGKELIIQFKNAGFYQDSLSNVDFQIRLYEKTNEFELLMGPSEINNPIKAFVNGPYCGIYKISQFYPTIINHRVAIHGDINSPSIDFDYGNDLDLFKYKLLMPPSEGTFYRFKTKLKD